ncbi:uncharacterized PurR-regulated membrane protein YhhQ (DUF165 family) [Actinokineospora baliensis]|uniref:VUT family protein n=1 Tax=Actinokineospora baliensis TaxID=547056 RepID=UPI00195988F0|nr:VUT family protein [Actinokineospora baliensis]MBM7770909.1 uncharacterized PurR-regulated membrane protein YhhQ (DUF165 family) [Actinokineospora baliensis]
MPRLFTCALALAFLAAVVGANMLTTTLGLVPAGFGLTVTAGTYAAGAVLTLRDALHHVGGRRPVLFVIAVGTVISAAIAPAVAIASGAAFALSELADYTVFTRLRRHGWVVAAVISNVVGAVVDTFVFLPLAGLPITAATVCGFLLVKSVWCSAALVLAAKGVRRALPGQREFRRHPGGDDHRGAGTDVHSSGRPCADPRDTLGSGHGMLWQRLPR